MVDTLCPFCPRRLRKPTGAKCCIRVRPTYPPGTVVVDGKINAEATKRSLRISGMLKALWVAHPDLAPKTPAEVITQANGLYHELYLTEGWDA